MRRQGAQRASEDVGEDKVVVNCRVKVAVTGSSCSDRPDESAGGVADGIVPSGGNGDRIYVAGGDWQTKTACGSYGENAGPGSHVEKMPWSAPSEHLVQHGKATPCRAVMPRSESESRFDFDSDVADLHAGSGMRSMNNETPLMDRIQSREGGRNPIARFYGLELDLGRGLLVDRASDEIAYDMLVRTPTEVDFDQPRSGRPGRRRLVSILESRGSRFGRIESFYDNVGDGPRRVFVAPDRSEISGAARRKTFKHNDTMTG